MDIIKTFGKTTYIFYSQKDVEKATSIFNNFTKDNIAFEDELEINHIDFGFEGFEIPEKYSP